MEIEKETPVYAIQDPYYVDGEIAEAIFKAVMDEIGGADFYSAHLKVNAINRKLNDRLVYGGKFREVFGMGYDYGRANFYFPGYGMAEKLKRDGLRAIFLFEGWCVSSPNGLDKSLCQRLTLISASEALKILNEDFLSDDEKEAL